MSKKLKKDAAVPGNSCSRSTVQGQTVPEEKMQGVYLRGNGVLSFGLVLGQAAPATLKKKEVGVL